MSTPLPFKSHKYWPRHGSKVLNLSAAELLEYDRLHPSSALTRVRHRNGSRVTRDDPLCLADLYETAARPPCLETTRTHQKCGLCGNVKSHPVSYECGHSHCYFCIRIHLKFDWQCPDCSKIITRTPYHHQGECDSLACDFPDWDASSVSYSWEGLTWPRPRIVHVVSDESS
ncbi:hypothetical protein B0H13DRAFT_2343428 [Mycena leptocephala]|nr:hypothetical protein B0H13DRAFT_2343428 [Mycena leptocephala]